MRKTCGDCPTKETAHCYPQLSPEAMAHVVKLALMADALLADGGGDNSPENRVLGALADTVWDVIPYEEKAKNKLYWEWDLELFSGEA